MAGSVLLCDLFHLAVILYNKIHLYVTNEMPEAPEESFIEHPLIADCRLGSFLHCTAHPRNHLVRKQQQPPFLWLSQYHKSRMSICTNGRISSHQQTYNTNQCTLISLRTGSPCLDASFRAIEFPHSVPLQKQEQIYSCSICSIR